MADIEQFEYINKENTPETARRIELVGDDLSTYSNEASAFVQEANNIINGLGSSASDALVDKSLIDGGTASLEKGVYRNNGQDFQNEIARSIASLQEFKEGNPSQSEEADKAISALEASLEKANNAQTVREYIEEGLTIDGVVEDGVGPATLGEWFDEQLDIQAAFWGRNTKQAKEKAQERQKTQEALSRDIERLPKELDPNDNYLNLGFREQGYIQKNLFNLVKIRNSRNFPRKTNLPYVGGNKKNYCVMCSGDPYAFMNSLTQPTSPSDMFDIPHHVLSNLQPEIRLYKVVLDKNGKELKEIEITFPATNTKEQIKQAFKNKRSRGYGIGMKSFEWVLEGSDPFAAKKMISATLTLHATTFTEILRDRKNNKGQPFRYADLAIKTGTSTLKKEQDASECFTKSADISFDGSYDVNFRLKAVVGYAIPKRLDIPRAMKDKYDKAIKASYATYDLIPTIHEFNFEDDGRVSFVINYQAYVQDFFDASYFDIFSDDNANTRQVYRDKIEKKIKSAIDEDSSKGSQEEDANRIKKLKTENLKILLTKLFKKDKMYFYNIPYEDLNAAMSSDSVAPFYSSERVILNEEQILEEITSLKKDIAGTEFKQATKNEKQKRLKSLQEQLDAPSSISSEANKNFNSSDHRQVTTFFLYDLIDTILEGINSSFSAQEEVLNELRREYNLDAAREVIQLEKENLKKARENFSRLRILLGPIEIRDPGTAAKNSESGSSVGREMYSNISIGEIPISAKYFSEWMADKMLSKDRRSYTLSTFIEEFMKNYVSVTLNDKTYAGVKATQPVVLHSTTLVSYGKDQSGLDEITSKIVEQNRKTRDYNVDKSLFEKNKPLIDSWCVSSTRNNTDSQQINNSILQVHGARTEPQAGNNLGQNFQTNWMVYYAGRSSPSNTMTGDRAADRQKGIRHYIMGQSSGIVKNIRLEKTSAPMLKELRYEQEGYDGLLQLREVYNVNIEMFLYPSVYPGTIIFVDPRGFAPDTELQINLEGTNKQIGLNRYELSRYGVGGYYMVISAAHRIAEGERVTQLRGIWLHSMSQANGAPAQTKDVEAKPASSTKKCGVVESTNSVCNIVQQGSEEDQVGAQPT